MHFQDATLKSLALKAGYATQEAKFELYMQSIKEAEIHALRKKLTIEWQKSKPDSYMPYTYLMKEDLDMWTQLHDGGYCYGAITTNISECFNGILKGARGLPITTMVEFTWTNLSHISMIDTKKLLMISPRARCGVNMPCQSMMQI